LPTRPTFQPEIANTNKFATLSWQLVSSFQLVRLVECDLNTITLIVVVCLFVSATIQWQTTNEFGTHTVIRYVYHWLASSFIIHHGSLHYTHNSL